VGRPNKGHWTGFETVRSEHRQGVVVRELQINPTLGDADQSGDSTEKRIGPGTDERFEFAIVAVLLISPVQINTANKMRGAEGIRPGHASPVFAEKPEIVDLEGKGRTVNGEGNLAASAYMLVLGPFR